MSKPGQQHVRGVSQTGVGKQGRNKNLTFMPANNVTNNKPKLGTTNMKTSIMGETPEGKGSGKAGTISNQKTKMPTSNYVNTSHKMGSTFHGVGEVPAYLKGKQGN